MTNYSNGHYAENIASEHLKKLSYEIVAMNWSTSICEIDIVARKDKVLYFVEVKYRSSDQQGDGLDYITPKKLKQMQFAAQIYINEKNYDGDFELSAIELSNDFKVTSFINQID